jgi:hypothetical protein
LPQVPSIRFAKILPIAQLTLAILLVSWGLWQRYLILESAGEWGWNSTARYHVWPFPLKAAVVLNTPAFLVAALFAAAVSQISPEGGDYNLAIVWAILIWWMWRRIGLWIDNRRMIDSVPQQKAFTWTLVALLMLISIGGWGLASISMYTSFIGVGIAAWALAGACIVVMGNRRRAWQ